VELVLMVHQVHQEKMVQAEKMVLQELQEQMVQVELLPLAELLQVQELQV
jgi:hypothetical protein